MMMKEGNFFSSINDTFVHIPTAAFVFDEPGSPPDAAYPGVGGYADGDIFYDVPNLTANTNDSGTTTDFWVNDPLFGSGTPYPGSGNLDSERSAHGHEEYPNVTDPVADFGLAGRAGHGSGNRLEMGGEVPTSAPFPANRRRTPT